MDQYSLERWMLDRQDSVAQAAEAHGARRGWAPTARVAELMAGRLRSLADRLDAPEPAEGRLRVLGDGFGDSGGRASTFASGSR